MKKYLLTFFLTCSFLPVFSCIVDVVDFTYFEVNNDGSWSVFVHVVKPYDTLTFISGTDTAVFSFTEEQKDAFIKNIWRNNFEYELSGDRSNTKLTYDGGKTEFIGSPLIMDQKCDSLQVLPTDLPYASEGQTIYFGKDFFLPSFTDNRYLTLDLNFEGCWFPTFRTYKLNDSGKDISPYVLRGIIYDMNGHPAKIESGFYYPDYTCAGDCYADQFASDADGNYVLSIHDDRKTLSSLMVPIQPITLGKPFGDTINVDIHLLGPLAEGEDAPDAISVQRSGNTLHVSGAVREIALIDASGRSLSCTRSADVDIELLPAGVYYLSVQMADGSLFRHPFSK